MLPGRVSNPGPLTYKSGALLIALRGPALRSLPRKSVVRLIDRPEMTLDVYRGRKTTTTRTHTHTHLVKLDSCLKK